MAYADPQAVFFTYQLLAAVQAEKKHQQFTFTSGIEGFSKDQLNKAETAEKNPLPGTDGKG